MKRIPKAAKPEMQALVKDISAGKFGRNKRRILSVAKKRLDGLHLTPEQIEAIIEGLKVALPFLLTLF